MNNRITIKTISLKDLWNVFRGCFLFVIAAAIVCTLGMYAYAKITYSPMYSSKATLFLIRENEGDVNQTQGEWTTDYTLAKVVISDTEYVLKSRPVLEKVGEELGIPNAYGSLRGSISIVNPEGTRALEITVTSYDPQRAKDIVDSLCKHGIAETARVLRYDRMHVYDEGTYSSWPSNSVHLSGYITYGIIAAAFVYLIFLAMFLFDNYIHTEDDIENYLGLSILGDIPDADAPKKKNKYSNYRGDKKRSYKQYYAAPMNTNNGKKE